MNVDESEDDDEVVVLDPVAQLGEFSSSLSHRD
jgi:hypothetical protein